MPRFKAEDLRETRIDVHGYPVTLRSYRLKERWVCHVDNVSPGAVIARGSGSSREDAEGDALARATARLLVSRRLSEARQALSTLDP